MSAPRFCLQCGGALTTMIPAGDDRARLCCTACGFIHYQNPKILVSCIVSWGDKVLWMQRAQPPRQGLWSIPSGFMERGETLQEAAARELYEECGVRIDPASLALYILGSITATSEVYAVFRGTLERPDHGIGPEALAVDWFTEEDAPWQEFAFPEVEEPMRRYYRDLRSGCFGLFMGEYTERGNEFWPVDAVRDCRG